MRPALRGDIPRLRLLHALGCPWGCPYDARLFVRCVYDRYYVRSCGLDVLRALLGLGCPVDWEAALEAAAAGGEAEVVAALGKEYEERLAAANADM